MSLLSAVLAESDKVYDEDVKQHCNEVYPQITELLEKVQLLSWDLQQNLIEIHVNFAHTKSLEQLNYKNRRDNIITDYEKLSVRVEDLQKEFKTKNDFNEPWTKLCEGIKKLKDICTASEGKRNLWNADHEFRRYKYVDAILEVEKLRKDLKEIQFDGDLEKALKNLRSAADNQLSLYVAQLSVEWDDLFSWSEEKCLYHLTYSLSVQQCDTILMNNVLKALYLSNRLNDELIVFCDYFINKLLHNLIRHNCEIYTDESLGAIIFNIKIDLTDKTRPNFQTIFMNLIAVFEFLQSTLDAQFDNEEKFLAVLSKSVKSEFFITIINDCIKTVLPTCETSYENYKNLVTELDMFNKFLVDIKFVKADESPLNQYMDTECVLHKKRYDKLLSDVRIIMKESLSYGTISVGVSDDEDNNATLDLDKDWDIINKPLFLSKCVISQNVKKIVMIIFDHLEESLKLPERFSNQLVLYIKDIALMYQWLVPKQFKINLESCPLDIALFFNNCFYLAHSFLCPSWRNVLPYKLSDNLNTTLIECIHDLRILGLEKISLYLDKQKTIIYQNILCKEHSGWTYDSYRQYKSAVMEALTTMKDLRCSWWGVLPSKMYEMSMSALIQALCQNMLDRLLMDVSYVQEDIILQIRRVYECAVQEIELLFEEPIEFEKKIINWRKFTKMTELLRAQLLEISELWNQTGELQMFTCEEVRKIIRIRFQDDDVRLKILSEIQ